MITQHVLPGLGRMKVADIRHADIDKLHRKITSTGARIRANRFLALLSRMFSLAVIWEMRSDNPVKGIDRNPETARHRYLEGDELERLLAAVAAHPSRQGAHVIELLLLTGARRSEVFTMRWEQLDLGDGIWTKPASATKQARLHRIPLSAPALSHRLFDAIGGPALSASRLGFACRQNAPHRDQHFIEHYTAAPKPEIGGVSRAIASSSKTWSGPTGSPGGK
jgi:integrase